MLRELLSIFRTSDPMSAMGERFTRMLQTTYDMTVSAGEMCLAGIAAPEERTRLYQLDVEVNQLERQIRKQLVAHLSIAGNRSDVPYSLALMSLVKDVERLGDYAKNLSEIVDLQAGAMPHDEVTAELREIQRTVENALQAASEIFAVSDAERALQLIHRGRANAHRCDMLIQRIAASTYDTRTATALVLATRYYKRIGGHILNVLSSVVMPLHKIDYYDEDEVGQPATGEPEPPDGTPSGDDPDR